MLSQTGWYLANTLRERVSLLTRMGWPETRCDDALAERKLQRWRSEPAFNGNEQLFRGRLGEDGLTEKTLTNLLSYSPDENFAREEPAPKWWMELEEILSQPASTALVEELVKTFPVRGDAGFLRLVVPMAAHALIRMRPILKQRSHVDGHRIFQPEQIERELLGNLWRQMLTIIVRTLVLELNVARLQGQLQGLTPQERYRSYVLRLEDPKVAAAIFNEYPVLARQVSLCILHWEENTLELLARLQQDWPDIRREIFAGQGLGLLTGVNSGAGDRHRLGHSVHVLTFADGARLVYKPRELAGDLQFQRFLEWFDSRGQHPSLRTMKILDCSEYGWCEFISGGSCESQESVERFYWRQGAQLALLYLVRAVDFHHENLIADGEYPVLVDLESLFHPEIRRLPAGKPLPVALEVLSHSVIRTGLLPFRFGLNAEGSEGVEISGLGGAAGQMTPHGVPLWEDPGTDEMSLVRKRLEMPAQQNRPALQGQDADVRDYADDLLAGFEDAYRLLMRHRELLLSNDGPLSSFAQLSMRCIVRPTQTYAILLYESFHPNLLRNALDRERYLDHLWTDAQEDPVCRRLISSEKGDLQNGDIPIFFSRPDSCDLWNSSGQPIPKVIEESSLELVQKRILGLGEQDLEQQTRLIKASFTALAVDDGAGAGNRIFVYGDGAQREISCEELLTEAAKIADRLESLSIQKSGEEIGWIAINSIKERHWTISPSGLDLYGGLSGIGMFLIYLAELSGDARYRHLAERVVATARRYTEELRPEDELPIGAFGPWGGMLYLLTHSGAMWGRKNLLTEGEELVERLFSRIPKDKYFDIIAGSAGCIAVLLSFFRATGSTAALRAAVQCGDRLTAAVQLTEQGAGWKTMDESGPPLTGFSHGAAGISWALLELAAVAGEARFRDLALRGFAYERALFSSETGNWPDLRIFPGTPDGETQAPRWMHAWCHGAPGIGLSRLLSRLHLEDGQLHSEILTAILATRRAIPGNHSLCHGALGNLDFLLQASSALNDPELHSYTYRMAAAMVDRVRDTGWLFGVPGAVETPGLMVGLAGIGYGLLRLASPEEVPCVLSLAPPQSGPSAAGLFRLHDTEVTADL